MQAAGARAVISTDGTVWNANGAFCSLVHLEEPALRQLGWRQLVHPSDRRYVAAQLVELMAGTVKLREFDARMAAPSGEELPLRVRVELVRDVDGRQTWFLVEAWATT